MGEDSNLLWLRENEEHPWRRTSQDGKEKVSHFGVELLGICSLNDMVICNGIQNWSKSNSITYKTYNVQIIIINQENQ